MSYLALYRKFRPKVFGDVIGQSHITTTLSNMIKAQRISHAYLLTGSRGTGKTTVAKIMARAFNCLHTTEDGSPCYNCDVCNIENNLDIYEIDAASNNSVDQIRDLRESIKYLPVNSKYKVYIIDEVHMLSTGAFNALLKTLEEPPAHVIFILATTEAHKLPATILSRVIRFDFRLIGTEELSAHLSKIFDQIGQKYQPEAVNLIAKYGAGSVRDMLSIADTCISYAPQMLTYDDVINVVGASPFQIVFGVLKAIINGNYEECLQISQQCANQGKNVMTLASDIIDSLRTLNICKLCKNPQKIVVLPEDRLAMYEELATTASTKHISYCIDTLTKLESELRYGLSPQVILENALIKCCNVATDGSMNSILAKLDMLEHKLNSGLVNVPVVKMDAKADNTTIQTKTKATNLITKDTPKANNSKATKANNSIPDYDLPPLPPLNNQDLPDVPPLEDNSDSLPPPDTIPTPIEEADDKQNLPPEIADLPVRNFSKANTNTVSHYNTSSSKELMGAIISTLRKQGLTSAVMTMNRASSFNLKDNIFYLTFDNSADVMEITKNRTIIDNLCSKSNIKCKIEMSEINSEKTSAICKKLNELSGGILKVK